MASVTFQSASIGVDSTVLVADVDVHVPDATIVAIVGPSGSGKSTLLRSIAGLGTIMGGTLHIGDVDVTVPSSLDRDVSMVFQEPALMPRRTGRRNVEFPLEVRRATLEAMRQRVDAEARALHIEYLLEKHPTEMSRGEAQLVQMARALVRVPQVLLLDEPFAALDEPRRRVMRADLKVLQAGYGVTTVIATNDPADAVALASHVVVLEPSSGGPSHIAQIGTLAEVRDAPATLDAATSLGDLWRLRAEVRAGGDDAWLVAGGGFRRRVWAPSLRSRDGSAVTIGVRTADVRITPSGAHDATVRRVIPGSDPRTILDVAGHLIASTDCPDVSVDARVRVDLDEVFVFDVEGRRLA